MFNPGLDGFIPGSFPIHQGNDCRNWDARGTLNGSPTGGRCNAPDYWHAPEHCNCLDSDLFAFCIYTVFRLYGLFVADENQEAIVYADGSVENPGDDPLFRIPADISAKEHYSGRNFWIYLDAEGYPIRGQAIVSPAGVGMVFQ